MQGANAQQVKRLEEAVEKLEARNRELLEAFQVGGRLYFCWMDVRNDGLSPHSGCLQLWVFSPLQVSRDEAAAGRQGTAWEGEELTKLRDQLAKARQRCADLELELVSEREALARMRSAERTVVDLTTGMSVEARRQIEELQKRVNILERQNQKLKRTLQEEEEGGGEGGNAGGGSGGGGTSGPPGRRPSSSGVSR